MPKDSKTKQKSQTEPANQYQVDTSETPAETFVTLFRKVAKKTVIEPAPVLA